MTYPSRRRQKAEASRREEDEEEEEEALALDDVLQDVTSCHGAGTVLCCVFCGASSEQREARS